jgi:hypothetical protein
VTTTKTPRHEGEKAWAFLVSSCLGGEAVGRDEQAHSRTRNWGTRLTREAYLLPARLSAWVIVGVVTPSRFSIPYAMI